MLYLKEQSELDKSFPPEVLAELNEQFEMAGPDEVLKWGHQTFGQDMVLGTGFGPSGMFLIYRLRELGLDTPVFYLDTHLLFDETYRLKDEIEQRFDINIIRVATDLTLEDQAAKFGEELWNRTPNRCCYLRKVLPLRNFLSDKKAWVTGVRRSQSETRSKTQFVEWDPENEVIKLNPLANWTGKKVWNYIRGKDLPYNPLHDEGYASIGCIPCTKPAGEGADIDERSGRWNDSDKTECGIHLPSQHFQNGVGG